MKELHIYRWLIGYLSAATTAGLIIIIFFREPRYPADQIAIVVAVPIMVVFVAVRLLGYASTKQKTRRRRRTEEETETLPNWIAIPSFVSLLACLGSLIVACTLFVSSGIYLIVGLEWASKTAWHSIAMPSFIVAGYSFVCLLLVVAIYIVKPYWHQWITASKKGFKVWYSSTKEVSINGFKVSLHP